MAASNYKPASYARLETRIVNGKSAKVEIHHGRIIRVYDDNYNIVDDRTVDEEKNFPPLLRPKINKSQEVYQINDIKSETIDKEPVLKIPSFLDSNTPEKEIKADSPVDDILNTPMQENQPPELPSIDQKQENIMEPNLNQISPAPHQIEEGKAEVKTDVTTDSPKQDMQDKPDYTKDIASEKDAISQVKDTTISIGQDAQQTEIKDQEKDVTPIEQKEDQIKDSSNQELIVAAEDSQKIEIKDQPQIDQNKETNKETVPILKNTISDIPKIIADDKLPISEGTTPPAATPSISTTSTISKLAHKLKPIFEQDKNMVNNTGNIPNVDYIPNVYNNRKDDNDIYNTSEHGKLKEKANINKEDKSMAEEVLEEYKRNKWAEDRDYKKNIEEMARTSLDNKEKIADISEKITGVEGKLTENIDKIEDVDKKVINLQDDIDQKVGNLQDNLKEKFGTLQNLQEHLQEHIKTRLGEVKTPVSETLGELCTGIDCIKEDLKKNQESSLELDKKMDSRFSELGERIQKLEVPTYVCDNCGYDELKPLSSFCPNCGTPVYGWSDPETGNPVAGWSPYWKRGQRAKYPE